MKTIPLSISATVLMLTCTVKAQTTIEVGQSYQFSQSARSTEHYSINLTKPGEFTIHISGWKSTYNWTIDFDRFYVRNADFMPVSQGQFSTQEDPFLSHMFESSTGIVFRVGSAGTYTISVHSGALKPGQGQAYRMSVSAVYCNDLHETNETMASATPLALGATVRGYQWKKINTSEVWGDEDWYQIKIPSPGKLRIEMIDWLGVYNWGTDFDRLYVYNSEGTSIGSQGGYDFYSWMMGGGTTETPHVTEMNLAQAGTYYLRYHSGVGTSTIPYRFSTSFVPAKDAFEPNDDFATAKPIYVSGVWNNAFEWRSADHTMNVIGDEDYYYFFAAGPGKYSLSLKGWIGIFNWGADYDRMMVYDRNKNSVGPDPLSWMMGETPVEFDIPAAGKYYIRLHCGGASSLDGYQFMLTGAIVGAEIVVEQPAGSVLVDGTAKKSFGSVTQGIKGAPRTFTIRNTGKAKLTGLQITKNGINPSNFIVTSPGANSLAPGAFTTFKVSFMPDSIGVRTATIHIKSNDPDKNPFDIKLSGMGTAP